MTDFARTHAHTDDIDTSHHAAESARDIARRHRTLVLAHLRESGPQASEQISAALNLTTLQVMKRISDLRSAGLVTDSGDRRRTIAGRNAAVWQAAE